MGVVWVTDTTRLTCQGAVVTSSRSHAIGRDFPPPAQGIDHEAGELAQVVTARFADTPLPFRLERLVA